MITRGAVLIDFGLAQEPGPLLPVGTPWYIPPEFRDGLRGYPADVWALGVSMLYLTKHIMLPERLPQFLPWNIGQINSHSQTKAQMSQWLREIQHRRGDLYSTTVLREHGEGRELGQYVDKMLEKSESQRITRSELAQQTRRWRSKMPVAR